MKHPATLKASPPLEIITRAPHQLGQALARLRTQRDLSQATLAQNAGLRQATVSKAEKGSGTTAIKTIYDMCAALGLELVVRPRPKPTAAARPEDIF
jgi:HTH-type transcriptional regulator/antitoxin HipB